MGSVNIVAVRMKDTAEERREGAGDKAKHSSVESDSIYTRPTHRGTKPP